MKDLITIIIPTYKRSEMLDRAINSVLNQTYQNFEILIVDDNNPNTEYRKDTEKFMKRYKDNHKIRYIKMEKNGGGAAARNFGIKNAKGKYIAFLDDDDEYLPEKLEKQLRFMVDNKLDASFSNELILDENGFLKYKKEYKKFRKDEILKYHLTEKIIGPQTFMYKKKVLDEINGFDGVPAGQEYVLMYKTIIGGYNVDYLDEDLVKIYIHGSERISTSTKKIDGERNLYELKKKHFDILNFRERQCVKFEWYINCYRYYGRKNFFYKIYYFLILLFRFPIQTIKTAINKLRKKYIYNKRK